MAKPWGESSRYDLLVDNGKRLIRMQVKSAYRARPHGGYAFRAHGSSLRAYNASEIDGLAAYVVGLDAWYLIRVEELFRKYRAMKLFPREQEEQIKI